MKVIVYTVDGIRKKIPYSDENIEKAKLDADEAEKISVEYDGTIVPPDTITVPMADGLDGSLTATRQGGKLSLHCEATGPVVAGGIIAVLPEGWRPAVPITAPAAIPGAAGATVTVSTDGTIRASAAGDGCWFTLRQEM